MKKHLFNSFFQEAAEAEVTKSQPQKRSYVSSEESLVEELGKLKKSA